MNRNKNFYSYIMWFIFAAFVVTLFIFGALSMVHDFGISGDYYDYAIVILSVVIICILGVLISFIFNKFLPVFSDRTAKMWRMVGLIIGIASIISARVLVFDDIVGTIERSGIISQYYLNSVINMDGTFLADFDSIEGIYNTIVSLAFRFLGNSGTALYICEQIIMVLSYILVYFSVSIICGGFEGFAYLITVSVMPLFIIHGEHYSSYCIEYFLFAFGLFIISMTIKSCNKRFLNYFIVIICAVYTGWLTAYSDLGIGLIIFLASVLIGTVCADISYRIINPVLSVVVFFITFTSVISFNSLLKLDFDGVYDTLLTISGYRFIGLFNEKLFPELGTETYFIFVLITGLIYAVMYFKYKKDSARHYILLLIIMTGMYCYMPKINSYASRLIIMSLYAIIGGCGLSKMFGNYRDFVATKKEIQVSDELATDSLANDEVEINDEKDVIDISSKDDEIEAVGEFENKIEMTEESVKEQEEPEVELFENPLPLPKKAVKRELEYDFDVPEDMMHYDIEVFDNI